MTLYGCSHGLPSSSIRIEWIVEMLGGHVIDSIPDLRKVKSGDTLFASFKCSWLHADIPPGIRVVIDVDDAFDLQNDYDEWTSVRLLQLFDRADAISVSSPALIKRLPVGLDLRHVPAMIPSSYLMAPAPDDDRARVVGWAAHESMRWVSGQASASDMHEMSAQAAALVTGFMYERVPLPNWPFEVVNLMSIGVAPMQHNEFNACKSALKPLTYAALGIPFVCSSWCVEYRQLAAELGMADSVLAKHADDWQHRLERLIDMPDEEMRELRSELRHKARMHTYLAARPMLAELLEVKL